MSQQSKKNDPEELPAEDTSRPRGRPPKRDKPIVISDDTENTQQKRVRKPKAEAQKRKQEENESLPPQKKQTKDVLKKIKAAMSKSNKADDIQLKQIEKAVAKADEVVKKAAKEKADQAATKKAALEALKARREHGVEKIDGQPKTWWERQTVAIIKQEAELRGHRFTDLETKGGQSTVLGVKTKMNKFKKDDYLRVLFKMLKL